MGNSLQHGLYQLSQFQELKAKGDSGQTLFYKEKDSGTRIVSRWVQPTIMIKMDLPYRYRLWRQPGSGR